jgi:hypothetical protein
MKGELELSGKTKAAVSRAAFVARLRHLMLERWPQIPPEKVDDALANRVETRFLRLVGEALPDDHATVQEVLTEADLDGFLTQAVDEAALDLTVGAVVEIE